MEPFHGTGWRDVDGGREANGKWTRREAKKAAGEVKVACTSKPSPAESVRPPDHP